MKKLKIVYLQVDHIPANGFTLLFFFTEFEGKIFWGSDNNQIDQEAIEEWLMARKILELKEPIIIDEDEILQISSDERIYALEPMIETPRYIGLLKELVK